MMLEKIIVGLIGTGITTIIGAYISGLQKEIEQLKNGDIPKPAITRSSGNDTNSNRTN